MGFFYWCFLWNTFLLYLFQLALCDDAILKQVSCHFARSDCDLLLIDSLVLEVLQFLNYISGAVWDVWEEVTMPSSFFPVELVSLTNSYC